MTLLNLSSRFSFATTSTFVVALPYMAAGLIVLAAFLFFYPRLARTVSASLFQVISSGAMLLVLSMFFVIAETAGWLWAFVYAAVIGIWLALRWWITLDQKVRSHMPRCPYCKSTRISIQANITTATCLNCGHILHIEQH